MLDTPEIAPDVFGSAPHLVDIGTCFAVGNSYGAARFPADRLHPVGFRLRVVEVDRRRLGVPTREGLLRESTPATRCLAPRSHHFADSLPRHRRRGQRLARTVEASEPDVLMADSFSMDRGSR